MPSFLMDIAVMPREMTISVPRAYKARTCSKPPTGKPISKRMSALSYLSAVCACASMRSSRARKVIWGMLVSPHGARRQIGVFQLFSSLAEIHAHLENRQDKMLQAARLTEILATATARAQGVLSDPVALVIQGRRATDNGQYLLSLGREINGLKTYAFASLELLDAFVKRHPRESFPRCAVPHPSSDGFQPAVSLSV